MYVHAGTTAFGLLLLLQRLAGIYLQANVDLKNMSFFFFSAIEMSGQLTEAPSLSHAWKGQSQEVLYEGL